ncbi:MAG TPA: FAD-dependent monooxygenase [Steroidobacteraceae bacterium]|nr:FAD-dependent monooxygenase [Steroidobacteraceae bacterium]
MRREFDVVVVGAGAVGTVAASLLVARKLCAPGRVAVIAERFAQAPPVADWDLRVFALSRASQRLLAACGVWERLPRDRIFGYQRMCVWDASTAAGGAGSLVFDCAEIGEPNLGSIVDGRELAWHCLQAARHAGVEMIEARLREIARDDAGVMLRLCGGGEVAAPLLLVADGMQSAARDLLGIGTAGHGYDQDALVAHVQTSEPHQSTAWQRFLASGPLALLPLPDGRCSIVWSIGRAQAARLRALDAAAFAQALDRASGKALGRTALLSAVASFPLRLQYASRYVCAGAALLGDAAHVVHPLAGQGLNMGLLDCAALAEVLGSVKDAKMFGDLRVLRRYERWRNSEILPAAAAFDGLDRLFSNSNRGFTALRVAGLELLAAWPQARRLLARRALGISGDLPSFLKS